MTVNIFYSHICRCLGFCCSRLGSCGQLCFSLQGCVSAGVATCLSLLHGPIAKHFCGRNRREKPETHKTLEEAHCHFHPYILGKTSHMTKAKVMEQEVHIAHSEVMIKMWMQRGRSEELRQTTRRGTNSSQLAWNFPGFGTGSPRSQEPPQFPVNVTDGLPSYSPVHFEP